MTATPAFALLRAARLFYICSLFALCSASEGRAGAGRKVPTSRENGRPARPASHRKFQIGKWSWAGSRKFRLTSEIATGVVVGVERRRGRGTLTKRSGRFEKEIREEIDDGWGSLEALEALKTNVHTEKPRSIITKNDSPDISFDRSINPYRGCEHGCVYCFARPTHAYMGFSPGLDFETELFVKEGAAQLLERELSASNYTPKVIAIGTNTDPYQPLEKRHRVMRSVLEALARAKHPVAIVTKSALILRDLDLLAEMAGQGLAKVAFSVTTLDPELARIMEPRAATPARRIDAMEKLAAAGVPVAVMTAPIIPAINDDEIEAILDPRPCGRRARGRLHHAAPAARSCAIFSANGSSSISPTRRATLYRSCVRRAAARPMTRPSASA